MAGRTFRDAGLLNHPPLVNLPDTTKAFCRHATIATTAAAAVAAVSTLRIHRKPLMPVVQVVVAVVLENFILQWTARRNRAKEKMRFLGKTPAAIDKGYGWGCGGGVLSFCCAWP